MDSIGSLQNKQYTLKPTPDINDNGNEGLSIKPTMSNDNAIDADKVDFIADTLVEKFGSAKSRKWYCKIAYALDADLDTINRLAAEAKEKATKSPGGLFNHLARKEARRRRAARIQGGLR